MHLRKVHLTGRLAGIACTPPRTETVEVAPAPLPAAPPVGPPPADVQAFQRLLGELRARVDEVYSQRQQSKSEVAALGVEIGIALAEHLLMAQIHANRHRLDRLVQTVLDRWPASRSISVRANPQDVTLLQGQLENQAASGKTVDLLDCRADDGMPRGKVVFETDDWFAEWDVRQCLAELRTRLLEETFAEDL